VTDGIRFYFDFCVFMFGAVIGSFLNVCIHRMPRGESIVRPPSHCPHCNQQLRWRDNIPLFGWLVLGGRCRYCRTKITPRYFLVELLTACLFLAVWLKYEFLWIAPVYWMLLGGLIAATFIDFEHYIIPDEITLGGVVVGLGLSVLVPSLHGVDSILASLWQSLLGVLVGGGLLFGIIEFGKLAFGRLKLPLEPNTPVRIENGKLRLADEEMAFEEIFSRDSDRICFRAATLQFGDQTLSDVEVAMSETKMYLQKQEHEFAQIGPVSATTDLIVIPREAMGMGDMKLMAGIGAFLGWQATLFSLMVSSLLGTIVSAVLIVLGLRELRGRIPYGPYIAIAAALWIFGGKEWVTAYFANLTGE